MPVSVRRFAAQWSLAVWIVTSSVIVGIVFLMGVMLRAAPHSGEEQGIVQLLMVAGSLFLPVVLGVAVLFAPLGYLVHDRAVVVHRMGRKIVIPLDEVVEIRRVQAREVGFAIRVFGSGGFFGYFGRFYSGPLGWFRAYATSTGGLVLITRRDGTKVLISPSPADAFVEAVQKARELQL